MTNQYPGVEQLPTDVQEEVADAIEALDQKARAAQPGEVVGETEIGGMIVRRRRQSTMVHFAGQELPERTAVYDRAGSVSYVPTAQLAYHLGKRDRNGQRVFFSKLPAGIKPKKPIDETCAICLERGVRKTFYSRYDWRGHMDSFHPRELTVMREENQEQRDTEQRDLMLAALRGRGEAPPAVFRCEVPGCTRFFDSDQGRKLHETTGHRRGE